MKRLVGMLVLGACTRTEAPDRATPQAPVGSDAARVTVAADATPAAAIVVDAAVQIDAAIAGPTVEKVGLGSCRTDADCTLTTYQEGCCTQGCTPYATSVRALAAEQAKEDCVAFKKSGPLCPPPAPCPVPKTRVIAATCKARRCYAVEVPRAP